MNSYAMKVKKSTSITVQTAVSNDRNFDNYIYIIQWLRNCNMYKIKDLGV